MNRSLFNRIASKITTAKNDVLHHHLGPACDLNRQGPPIAAVGSWRDINGP